ncbi:1-acyl-sn-glycerol-3-phosphate acyltransferase [uncultured Roseobacter sp.]|uniref:1-acyl-sn-glycerol-3-phosphate acyltransferase n=1 Tax=uncultured Roseobacter sp. TaxID=114847 RepID=UPI0026024417|nr:1-acyl-sn-glycerol-3-phosphate acyltransferase [uncultured Roseobacter sp.]
MKERLEPLIAERAPWLVAPKLLPRSARYALDKILSYDAAVSLADDLADEAAGDVMDIVAARLAKNIQITGLEHVPSKGSALIVANHPTGIGDGIMLWHVLSRIRSDIFFYANSDILRVLPQMHDLIAPVEWRHDKRTHTKTRETMLYTRSAFDAGKLGVIFPSGRLAKRRGLTLHERPWMTSAATLARKFELPVVPINIQARNSGIFYLFDLIHPTLRDITLFHETLNKAHQPFRIAIGRPIFPASLPVEADKATEAIRYATLDAGNPRVTGRPVSKTAKLHWIRTLSQRLI